MKRLVSSPLVVALLLLLAVALAGCRGDEGTAPGAGDASAASPAAAEETTASPGGTTASAEGVAGQTLWGEIPQPRLPTGRVTIAASGGEAVVVEAEIADGNRERFRGLMARERLREGEGMLFVFGDERPRNFTMRNTLVPLSIAYISAEGRIVSIVDMEPLTAGPYPSGEPARYALEVPQGFFTERGVEVGDAVELPGA